MTSSIAPLLPWINAPTVMKPIIEALIAAGKPMTLRDICDATGFNNSPVARTMPRLSDKGIVTRRKIPLQQVIRHRAGPVYTINKTQWLYEISEDYHELCALNAN